MPDLNNTNNYYLNNRSLVLKGESEPSKIPIITKPIDKVENIVNSTVDMFVPETKDEEKKKSHKKMVRAGSTALVLGAFVLLLNPKFSSSFINKLKTKSAKAGDKAKVDNTIVGAFNKIKETFLNAATNIVQILNNANSTKDTLFKKLCDKTKLSSNVHKWITKKFDAISKHTVFYKYKKANNSISVLDDVLKQYQGRLTESEKQIFESKLKEIKRLQEYFSEQNIKARLSKQEELMENLEKDVTERIIKYKDNFLKSGKDRKDVYNFWAGEALATSRKQIEADGANAVESLIGDGNAKKGAYKELLEILEPHLKNEEKAAIEERIIQTGKKIKHSNLSECVEYFDKKRDLMLGSAPTDIVTALFSLIACSIAIGRANSKEDRISTIITGALPVVAGVGVSTALTALLFSGSKGLMLGAVSSAVLSGIGSGINRILFPKNIKNDNITENSAKNEKVVLNA